MSKKIWLSSPHMGGYEEKFIEDAFAENWVAPLGPNVDGFEKDIQDYLGGKYVAALSSGTSAIHLALILAGVERDDEVLCQSFTFSATANPILYLGAIPVFVDSEKTTWNMSPEFLEEAIRERIAKGKKPKLIIPVHLYGMPARMEEILNIGERYDIPILEDAAEALGSSLNGQKAGSFGIMSVLSFNGNKIITTSGGGALVSGNEELVKKARFLATQARDPAPHYQHTHIGYNYRMSNICAGIGRGQMQVLDEWVAKRIANFEFYRAELKHANGIGFQEGTGREVSNRWLTAITVDPQLSEGINREKVRLDLEKENIESRPLWKPLHMQPIFAEYPFYGSDIAERLFIDGLCLPSGSNLTINELQRITEVVKASLKLC